MKKAHRTLDEQIALAKSHATRLGATYLGWRKGASYNYFGFAKKGYEDRWTSLARLNDKQNPFNTPTIFEQELRAQAFEKRLGATYIGWKKGKSRNYFCFSKEGFEDRWISLASLDRGHNPFSEFLGFSVKEVGYFYMLLVTIEGKQYIKFGITNNVKSRFYEHKQSVKRIGGKWSSLHVQRIENGQECLDFETALKRQFKDQTVNFGVKGFRSECFNYRVKDAVIAQMLK